MGQGLITRRNVMRGALGAGSAVTLGAAAYALGPSYGEAVGQVWRHVEPSGPVDLPYLAQLLDNVPKDRRVVIDPTGRFNETIRVDDDFNHLEKLDGHQGWEWIDAMRGGPPGR